MALADINEVSWNHPTLSSVEVEASSFTDEQINAAINNLKN